MALTISGSGGGTALNVPKIETGSYTGQNKYGSSNPSSLTFSGVPILVFIKVESITPSEQYALFYAFYLTDSYKRSSYLQFTSASGGYLTFNESYAKLEGTTLTWYNTNSAARQFNASYTYSWMALTL